MKNNNEIFEKNIEKLMKLTETNDQPSEVFVEKLIDDAMDELITPRQNRKLNTRRRTMKVIFKSTAAIAAALIITAGVITVYRSGLFESRSNVAIDSQVIEESAGNSKATGTELIPIPLELPPAVFTGTPTNIQIRNLEKPLGKPRPPFYAPAGTTNVALNKPVTSTDDMPVIGEIHQITDGDKQASDGSLVELGPFDQHITIDLGAKHNIYAIVVWHFHKQGRAYYDVVVQTADDPDFITNVNTVFNNDDDNSLGLGTGKDKHYVETNEGKLIDAKGVQARYIRLYSNGNNANDMNHYVEVEVYGKPVNSQLANQ